ncbi:hypothetical protein SAMN05444920_1262 [Nonomuraea solani]|uniref:Uncharacterized protein n=1 Tax=Nonomuraea solani TaxID=1144553 RepID=A0A1H6F079_9ACTN|nr:hypothetical protein SAMN05444920_1262 [Nonomuraea solani]
MPFSEGWRDHYDRMLRSRRRLAEAAGPSSIGSDEARDHLYHFFQDSYHLKDWLVNDPSLGFTPAAKQALERHITATRALANCADLCNGTKHLVLNNPRVPGTPANLASQSVSVTLGAFETVSEFGPSVKELATPPADATTAEHLWLVEFDGHYYDAANLADEVVAEWQNLLRVQGLIY